VIDALALWGELSASAPAQPGIVRRRVLPESERDLFFAVAHPSAEKMLILRVLSTAIGSAGSLPSTRGVSTSLVHVDDSHAEVRVGLAAPEILRVFATFVEDVAILVAREPDDEGALRAFTTRFAHWRRLLAAEPRGGLSRDAAQGLWGELWVLRHTLLQNWGDGAIDGWTGSERDEKDFRRSSVAIEVKSTRADAPHAVRINGEHQLEDPGHGGTLLLAVLDVDSHRQGAGETLNDAVASTRQVLEGPALIAFDEKLAAYGYSNSDADLYGEVRHSLREMLWYSVVAGFPRITSNQLPDGVGRVTYLLSTDACSPWRIVDADLDQILTPRDVP
jgi:hypothetical protein